MHDISSLDCSRIAQDLQIRKLQVEAVVLLLDEGNTIPFITRYRKERTGGLNEEFIRQIQTRVQFLRQLGDRKQTILKSIDAQGKLTDELRGAILIAETGKRLEDLYLPYKPKKKSLATTARERGLEPLALAVWQRDPAVPNLEEILPACVNPDKQLATADDVRAGVQHILAEMIAETADVRAAVRALLWDSSKIKATKSDKLGEGQGLEYKDYFEFTEPARQIPAHRILALNRGEKESALKVHLEFNPEHIQQTALRALAESLLRREQTPRPEPKMTPVAVNASMSTSPGELPVASSSSADVPAALAAGTEAPEIVVLAGMPAAPEQPKVPEATPLVISLSPSAPPLTGAQLIPGVNFSTPHAGFLCKVLDDALARLLLPSLEREIRHELANEAESHAVAVFARNLRSLLLQPPLANRRVLGIDPGMRTGCKIAALDEFGNMIDQTVIYPFGSQPRRGKDRGKAAPAAAEQPAAAPAGASPVAPPGETAEGTGKAACPTPEEQASSTPIETPAMPPNEPSLGATGEIALVEHVPHVHHAADFVPSVAQVTSEAGTPPPTEDAPQPVGETVVLSSSSATAPAAVEPTPPPPDRKAEAKGKLKDMIVKHNIQVVALGNGTGCRETEEMIADLIASGLPELAYVIVNEAGASVYSVSAYGREEFPSFDSTLRSTISIGRRLQDPLAELVKVDPPNIGVGLYQHDINRKDLRESLDAVVESCVNQVGVDLNTASVPLLRHVSGLNQLVARELVDYRQKNGPFTSREQLRQVAGVGPTRYVQAAGFLKIQGPNPLDHTWIHPESYSIAEKILEELGYTPKALEDKAALEELQGKLKALQPDEVARRLDVGVPTIENILAALARPGRDPREDLPLPIFKKGILRLEDLQPGMDLKGTVLNVVDFGAFVDIGLKDSGLVHISQMANRYIKSPYDVLAVSDVVTVWVLNVDKERHRVSLSMIQPGTERKPPEKRPYPPREQGGRPPRERRPAVANQGQPQAQGPPQGDRLAGERPPGDRPQGDRGGRPSRGRHGPGRGPGRGPGPGTQPQSAPGAETPGGATLTGAETPVVSPAPVSRTPAPPPRKPRREPPKPKLSQAALEGKVPLRTFGELSVLFTTKEKPPEPEIRQPEPRPPEAVPVVATVPSAESGPAAGESPGEKPS